MNNLKQTFLIFAASLLMVPDLSQATDGKSAQAHKMPIPKADIYSASTKRFTHNAKISSTNQIISECKCSS